MENSVIGIDLGTQGVKVVVYNPSQKKVVHSASAPLELISRADGSREQLAEWWIEAFHQCLDSIPVPIRMNRLAILCVSFALLTGGDIKAGYDFLSYLKAGRACHRFKACCDGDIS